MKKIWLLILCFAIEKANCQIPEDLMLQEFLNDIQKFKSNDQRMQGVWWVPLEYWDVVKKVTPQLTEEAINQVKNTLKDYLIFAVYDGTYVVGGGHLKSNYKSTEELKPILTLFDAANMPHKSLQESEITPEALVLSAAMEPILAQVMGETGQGMHIFYFKNMEGTNKIGALEKGKFTMKLDNQIFEWNLPLSTLLPGKVCPTDNQRMKGSWQYCPFHGVKLQ